MTSQKATYVAWGQGGQCTAIGDRKFTRSRGRTVRYEASNCIRRREIEWDFTDRETEVNVSGVLVL